ncbi:MAG: aldehyde dehydrogenase family protein [Streptomyces sp.]|jgi:betaine-aldehyde dehydrogenase|nr:aldehyde dehydrogenase family protein [Streptomyces sp.]
MQSLQNYVDGRYTAPKNGVYTDIEDPSTATAHVRAPLSSAEDVDLACQAAARAFRDWRRTTPGERSLMLFRAADALEARAEDLIEAEVRDTGKPLQVVRDEELPMTLDFLRFYAAAARELRGPSAGSFARGFDSQVRREPVGVCAQVVPWNYPLMMAVWKFGPALAAGNTVVLKPSDTTPSSMLLAAGIIGEILPAGVLNVVAGDRDTGRALVAHDIPELVSVTGSERAGIEVSGAVAADLKRVSLELGGKAPVLVFADTDLEATAAGVVAAGLVNAGQDCEAACRVLVEESVRERFTELMVAEARAASFGPPAQEGITYGALNSGAHLAKVEGFINRLPAHARVLTGGNADRTDGGYYFEPTIVAGVRQDDEIVREEVFGPVITVQGFGSEAEAVRLANDVRFGLAASIWTNDHTRIVRLSDALDFGKVWVNCHLMHAPEMPNGGYKHSGHGNDLSVLAIEEYTRVKHVMSAVPQA